jgi:hypothetical protein
MRYNLHYDKISDEMKSVLDQLMKIDELMDFRLVGGTNLALQLGHRTSVDIDLFAGGGAPAPDKIGQLLIENFATEVTISRVQRYGLAAIIRNIKVDIYDWKVPFSGPPLEIDGIRLATVKDIFAFKCEALLGRRAEKDFIDIAEILLHYPLEDLFQTFHYRYPHYTKAAIITILLEPNNFERDKTVQYSLGKQWEKYVEILNTTLKNYEDRLQEKKQTELDDREKKIQALVEQKRKRK